MNHLLKSYLDSLTLSAYLVFCDDHAHAYDHDEDDGQTKIVSSLAVSVFGLRLNYYFNRHIAPYIGVKWEKKIGNTADFSRNEG